MGAVARETRHPSTSLGLVPHSRAAHLNMFILDHSSLLLFAPRNVFTAVGLPLAIGMYSGSYTAKVTAGRWYKVCPLFCVLLRQILKPSTESSLPTGQDSQPGLPLRVGWSLPRYVALFSDSTFWRVNR